MNTKELSRRIFEEIYSKGRLDMIEDTHDDHCRLRDPSRDTVLEGPETMRRYVEGLRRGFPDFRIEVDRQIAEGDTVASRVVCHGTHNGTFMGLEPTHKKIHVRCTIMQRFRDQKVVEADVMWDLLGFLNQVELAPARALWENMMAAAGMERKVRT